ncbi:MAG: AarF/UbiB family protein [Chloroflexia bacterium]
MWPVLRTARHWRRFRTVAAVLARHGLGWLADAAGLPRLVRRGGRLRRPPPLPPYPALGPRLRRAVEELGPTFVLLGRYLSTRADLLPDALRQELALLPEAGPLVPPDEVASRLQQEFGRPLEALFADLNPTPLYRSWTEQVHPARTTDGREVWVHVPIPEVRVHWEETLPMLLALAELIERRSGGRLRIGEIVHEFALSVRQEMDAAEQARTLERWQQALSDEGFLFPEVDAARTTSRVLTHLALTGQPLPEAARLRTEEAGELAKRYYRFWGRAAFEAGLYPAPPALGAPMRCADGRLAPTAFAPVGHLDTFARHALVRLLQQLAEERMESALSFAAALGLLDRFLLSTTALQAVRHLAERYRSLPAREVRLHALAEDLFALAKRGVIRLPERFRLLLCTLVAVEEFGTRIAPEVSAAEQLYQVLERTREREKGWEAYRMQALRAGRGWLELISTFPESLRHLLARAAQDDLLVGVELEGWQRPMRRLERMVLRLVLAILCAGLAFALTLLVTTMLPGRWTPWGWLPAGLVLLLLAGLTLALLLTFLRTDKR